MNIFQTAIWIILFITPGYLASTINRYWMFTTPRQPTDKTVESIIWSLITYFVLTLLPFHLFQIKLLSELIIKNLNTPELMLFDSTFLKEYFFVLLVAIISNFLIGRVLSNRLMTRLLKRTPYARVWDEFFQRNGKEAVNNGVWLQMKDGTQWAGKLKTASDTPGSSELWVKDIRKYENNNLYETQFSDMLVNIENVSRMFILKDGLCEQVESNNLKKRFSLFFSNLWVKGRPENNSINNSETLHEDVSG